MPKGITMKNYHLISQNGFLHPEPEKENYTDAYIPLLISNNNIIRHKFFTFNNIKQLVKI